MMRMPVRPELFAPSSKPLESRLARTIFLSPARHDAEALRL